MNSAIIKPQWGPLTIGLMVLGFITFWPLGLAVLAYVLWGEMFGGSADKAGRYARRSREFAEKMARKASRYGNPMSSGNAAFDEYREEQLKRLDEERRRLDEEVDAFHAYMRNLRMARDREEFDRFLRERNMPKSGQ